MAGLLEFLQQSEISPLGFFIFRVILQHPCKSIFILIDIHLYISLSFLFFILRMVYGNILYMGMVYIIPYYLG